MSASAPMASLPGSAPGSITTFYSYKGGTGRTMALANTAYVLAERLAPGEKVLVVDWDLEAPGLHRFFPPRLRGSDPGLHLGLDAGPGLIDLFIALAAQLPAEAAVSEDDAEELTAAALAALDWPAYIGQTEHAAIHILRAGRNDDGGYGKRVNTFDWEGLFRRAPGIYRAFAERLARDYRWVLVDSRTGVTDISGICTSLLPEKLVVVFTPNRQSLTGVRELVLRATGYRRASDDLRPLLVLPLPSRIEASMEKLRIHWRHGRPEEDIHGYQPMFEALLAECYGLPECRLGDYFDAVQIQQSPDCAYGEVISVRAGSGDRFSLASSYRVFVDHLVAGTPPWWPEAAAPELPSPAPQAKTAAGAATATAAARPRSAADPGHEAPLPALGDADAGLRAAAPASAASPAPPRDSLRRVFVSYATEDRERVAPVVRALQARGMEVFWDRGSVLPGQRWDDVVADALDQADVVVAFWSHAAFASEAVRVEAEEGMRRGVLLPVLLDDARSPVSFRGLQAADLRRDFKGQLGRLVDDVDRIARAAPGDRTVIVPMASYPPPAPPDFADTVAGQASVHGPAAAAASPEPQATPAGGRAAVPAWIGFGLAMGLVVLAAAWWLAGGKASPPSASVGAPTAQVQAPVGLTAARTVSVPDFKDRRTDVASEIARSLDLVLTAIDAQGQVQSHLLDGLVLDQTPAAGTQVPVGSTVTLKIATRTSTVPSIGGLSLSDALAKLRTSGLELGAVESVEGTGGRVGAVVRQSPQAGAVVAAGEKISVGVAAQTTSTAAAQATRPPPRLDTRPPIK